MADQGSIGDDFDTYFLSGQITSQQGAIADQFLTSLFLSGVVTDLENLSVKTWTLYGDVPDRGTGVIRGTVKQNNVPVQGRTVRLYERLSGQMVAVTTSGSDGLFLFTGLQLSTPNYFVIAFDDTTLSPDFNAKIFDLITPTS